MTDISGNQGRNSAKVLWGSREPELKREQVVLLMISKGSWEHMSPWEGLLFFPSRPTAHARVGGHTSQLVFVPFFNLLPGFLGDTGT